MNTTTANSAAALLALGGAQRADARNSGATEPAGQGDFQRLLAQAAEKKSALKQQQSRQLESGQAAQRLQDRKLQESRVQANKQMESRLEEQLQQAKIRKSRETDAASATNPGGRSSEGASAARQARTGSARTNENDGRSETAAVDQVGAESAPPTLSGGAPVEPQTAAAVAEAPTGFELPMAPVPSEILPADGTSMAEVVALQPDAPLTISLEDIAQAVVNGPAAEGTAGALANSSAVATSPQVSSALAETLRNAPGGSYGDTGQQASAQSSPADGLEVTTDDAVANTEFNLAALTRQLGGNGAQNQAAGPALSGSQLADPALESVGGAQRDAGPVPTATSGLMSGAAQEGKFASLLASAPGHPATPVRAGLDQPEWHSAIAERVAVMAAKNLSSAEIQLDPPELGQLLVRVTLNQEQASVNFSSQHAAVRDALDQTSHRLREMFEAEGMNLVNVDVSDRSFQQRQQQETAAAGGGDGAQDESAAEPVVVRQGQGLIDQFV